MRVEGGIQVGRDGRAHGAFTHNPSSLRLSMHNPSLHQIPRGSAGALKEYEKFVKEIFVAPLGHSFYELDFNAIEAVLVGYFAGSARYVRFAKLGVHDYLASHLLGMSVDLSRPDTELKAIFADIKATETATRDIAKRVVHLSNYRGTPRRMHMEYPETFPTIKDAQKLQDIYFGLFPEIPKWHWDLCERVDGTKRRRSDDPLETLNPWTLGVCYVTNPFGYRHEFYHVLDWEHVEAPDGEKMWVKSLGDDAKRLISNLPQSTAAGVIKRAAKMIWYQYPWVGENLRLLIHDSILGECPDDVLDMNVQVCNAIMTAPIPELPLDPSWGMGDYLTIGVEVKTGKSWGALK